VLSLVFLGVLPHVSMPFVHNDLQTAGSYAAAPPRIVSSHSERTAT